MYQYETEGVCASRIFFDIKDGKVFDVRFENGCNGNGKGVGALAEGMDASELVRKLKGTTCGRRPTSCPDQLAKAIESVLKKNSAGAAA